MKTTRSIDSMENGIVIDHIGAGKGMKIYDLLHLDDLDCTVVLIRNARSGRYGRKDIIKIEGDIRLDLDLLGYVDHNITVSFIQEGKVVEKKKLTLPKRLVNVIRCRNPRCICTVEEG
ncbi:MAG TPA: aspartate carbamoyltransferase regulatory subunit, partial [Candidatus Faecivivens stercoravium]|nr:aspartate carbamoyltransferase regulatory subunit [Candidatus Faecivivens stercoravium]